MTFKPMLAAKVPSDLTALRFPLLVSPKLDGIRCICRDEQAVSRSLLPIPNAHIQRVISKLLEENSALEGLDGELLLPNLTENYNDVQSAVMSEDGEPKFVYAVFDHVGDGPYHVRLKRAADLLAGYQDEGWIHVVQHHQCESLDELLKMHTIHIGTGFEGTMIRSIDGPYKFGRATTREGTLMKLKDFDDAEAVVHSFEPLYENHNPQTRDALGHAERSSAQENLVATEKLGAVIAQADDGTEVRIGSGFSEAQRINLWIARDLLNGMRVKFKHLPPPGGRKPGQGFRHPVFLGWRDHRDA